MDGWGCENIVCVAVWVADLTATPASFFLLSALPLASTSVNMYFFFLAFHLHTHRHRHSCISPSLPTHTHTSGGWRAVLTDFMTCLLFFMSVDSSGTRSSRWASSCRPRSLASLRASIVAER